VQEVGALGRGVNRDGRAPTPRRRASLVRPGRRALRVLAGSGAQAVAVESRRPVECRFPHRRARVEKLGLPRATAPGRIGGRHHPSTCSTTQLPPGYSPASRCESLSLPLISVHRPSARKSARLSLIRTAALEHQSSPISPFRYAPQTVAPSRRASQIAPPQQPSRRPAPCRFAWRGTVSRRPRL
jgi:hypothetical protein